MLKGVSFKGINSNTLGLFMFSDNRQTLSSLKDVYIDTPLSTGNYLFSDEPNDKELVIEFQFASQNLEEKRYTCRQIAAWLRSNSREQLIFDDEPDKFYLAKVSSEVNMENLITAGRFRVIFRCLPYAFSTENSGELEWGEFNWFSEATWEDENTFTITEPTDIEVNNFGTATVRPLLQLDGSFSTIQLTVSGKTLNYTEAITAQILEIDNDRYTARIGTTNKLNALSSDSQFLELPTGVQEIAVAGTNLNVELKVLFKPRFH